MKDKQYRCWLAYKSYICAITKQPCIKVPESHVKFTAKPPNCTTCKIRLLYIIEKKEKELNNLKKEEKL